VVQAQPASQYAQQLQFQQVGPVQLQPVVQEVQPMQIRVPVVRSQPVQEIRYRYEAPPPVHYESQHFEPPRQQVVEVLHLTLFSLFHFLSYVAIACDPRPQTLFCTHTHVSQAGRSSEDEAEETKCATICPPAPVAEGGGGGGRGRAAYLQERKKQSPARRW
jgi:hypothetical protein